MISHVSVIDPLVPVVPVLPSPFRPLQACVIQNTSRGVSVVAGVRRPIMVISSRSREKLGLSSTPLTCARSNDGSRMSVLLRLICWLLPQRIHWTAPALASTPADLPWGHLHNLMSFVVSVGESVAWDARTGPVAAEGNS